ncbi:MAG: cobalamin biosynthesis protein CobD [Lachnospiraceae bacterium]|nr:cobalamin biosynthesis protein CobD [Lachnospiraceae bacterium]
METILAVTIGFLLDLCFGDPYWMPHPIRAMGTLIAKLDGRLRKEEGQSDRQKLVCGIVLVVIVTVLSVLFSVLMLVTAYHIHPVAGTVLQSMMCYQMFAAKCLKKESMKVYEKLKEDDLPGARTAVSMIVGRDTKELTKEGVAKAAVETVAENTSDGEIAPLFYMALFGAVGGYFYKAVNTMDSMVGYKNDKYLYFGRAAAKLDDVMNYVPARISAVLMILASGILRLNMKNAIRIFKRDRYNHASPNSAQTEAVCAGALDIELAGDAYYFGKLYKKKTIGDPIRPITFDDIRLANRLLYGTASLGVFFMILIGWIVSSLF